MPERPPRQMCLKNLWLDALKPNSLSIYLKVLINLAIVFDDLALVHIRSFANCSIY